MAEELLLDLPVVDLTGKKVGQIFLYKDVFAVTDAHEQAVLDAVLTERANARQATAKTKKRHEVSGGGKKPWRQKGTGRARAGSSRSPLWVGGGKVFGPDGNQNYAISQNKKAYALALKTVLSAKAAKGLIIVNDFVLAKVSTKAAVGMLAKIGAEGKTLVIADLKNTELVKSLANLADVKLVSAKSVSVYDVMDARNVVVSKDDIKVIEGGLR